MLSTSWFTTLTGSRCAANRCAKSNRHNRRAEARLKVALRRSAARAALSPHPFLRIGCGAYVAFRVGSVLDKDERFRGSRSVSFAPIVFGWERRARYLRNHVKPATASGANLVAERADADPCSTTSTGTRSPQSPELPFTTSYFRLYKGSVKGAGLVKFLAALRHHVPGPLTIVGTACLPTRAGHEPFHCRASATAVCGIRAGLRAGTQPGRARLGLLEAVDCRMFARKISGRPIRLIARPSNGCAAVHAFTPLSGNKPNCSSIDSILCERQIEPEPTGHNIRSKTISSDSDSLLVSEYHIRVNRFPSAETWRR